MRNQNDNGSGAMTLATDMNMTAGAAETTGLTQELYEEIRRQLAEGHGIRMISRQMKVPVADVMAVRNLEEKDLPVFTSKDRIRRNLRDFVEAASERLVEELGDMKHRDVVIGMGVALDKLLVLEGRPSSRVEVTHRRQLSPEALLEMMHELQGVGDEGEEVEVKVEGPVQVAGKAVPKRLPERVGEGK